MITVTLKYTDYGHKETEEFRDYTKNLIGYRQSGDYELRFGRESDPMFDDKIVAQIMINDEDHAFDVVNHFIIDREVNGDSAPFDIDLSSVAIYVTGSDRIMDYLTSRSFSSLFERLEIAENGLAAVLKKNAELTQRCQSMQAHIERLGVDKFPDIVRELIDSMEAEGHSCKINIEQILQRKVH